MHISTTMSDSKSSQPQSQPVDGSLDFIEECPVCERKYGEESVQIIEQNGEANLMHITCSECLNSVIAVVVMSNVGSSSIGVLTDLEPEDIMRLKGQSKFSHDQILEFHLMLQQEKEFESAVVSEVNQVKC